MIFNEFNNYEPIRKTSFATSENLYRHNRTPLLESEYQLQSEYEVNLHEISKKKKRILDDVPTHIALFIYQTSKLIFFEFVIDLFNCLEEYRFKICYCDTDSIMLALVEDSLDDLVKPGKEAEWNQIKSKWFADSSPRSQKTPGLLKEEFTTTTGSFVGLRHR